MGILTAKDLQRRYRAGERNFAGVDLSGESLRGMNLKGINLSGADLSRTDIRGTNFTGGNLEGTQFTEAKAGSPCYWLVPQLFITFVLSAIVSFLLLALWAVFAQSVLGSFSDVTEFDAGEVRLGLLRIFATLIFLALIYFMGTSLAVGSMIGTFAIAFFVGMASVGSDGGIFSISVSALVASTVLLAVFFTLFQAISIAGVVTGIIFGIAVYIDGFYDGHRFLFMMFSGVVCSIWISFVMSKRALSGDSRERLIRNISVWLSSWSGTKFSGSNLTDASFFNSTLGGTNFYQARLTRTQFHHSKKINSSRLDKTILANFQVQSLLVTLRGSSQSYIGLNLKGANLAGANLSDSDLTEADISQATLEGASLERANLTKTQALGTNFHQTILTGATLEAWNIDSNTNLDGAICDYVYLLRNQQERRPSSGSFAPGEFTKLFQEVLDTIDLIFQNGVDWKAFIQTLNTLQVEHEGANLQIQAIENKGDGVVVVKLHAAPAADKAAIHQGFMQRYQKALKAVEQKYKAQLHAKDKEIRLYRQQGADMRNIAELLAQRPINVDVKATAESKAMQGNDNSRNISIGGNATGNVFQTGDGNTASIEFQQVTLPPPDRVNIQAELAALQAILAGLNDPVTTGIAAKLDAEAAKPAPDKSAVATTLETGLTYARNLQGFAEAIDKLRPHVQNAAGWLGEHGTKLLPLVGLVL